MRADARQTPSTKRIGPPSTPTEDLLSTPPVRSAPRAQSAETPSEVPLNPPATEAISLLPDEAASRLRSRWDLIQSEFVDDPRRSVDQAGALVEEALDQLSAVFREKRSHVQRVADIPTEDLRQTLRHYRLLLNRLF